MTITSLPTRAAGDLGATLTNTRTPTANELSAVNVERIKDWIIQIATEIGLTSGATAGSVWERLIAAEGATTALAASQLPQSAFAGTYAGALMRTGVGVYATARHTASAATPTTSDDDSLGYARGSLWFHVNSESGAFQALYVCGAPSTGAAVWFRVQAIADLLTSLAPSPDARTAAVGTSPTAARADHVHDRAVLLARTTVTSSTTLGDHDFTPVDPTSGAITLTLPSAWAVAAQGREYEIHKIALTTNSISIARSGSDTIRGLASNLQLPGSDLYARGTWRIRAAGGNWLVVGCRIDYPEPSEVSGLVGDWRAESGVTLASGRVSAWADYYGSGRSFAQGTAGNQPLFRANGAPGGRPSLYFARSRPDYLTMANESAWNTIADWSALIVCQTNLQSGTSYLLGKTSGGAAQPFDFLTGVNYTLGMGPNLAGATLNDPGTPSTSGNPNGPPVFAWHQLGFIAGSGTAVQVMANGGTVVAGTHTRTAGSQPIWLGNRADLPANGGWNGEISRVVIFSRALSIAEYQGVARHVAASFCA